jgi:mono/diheme cytochrome c family protein
LRSFRDLANSGVPIKTRARGIAPCSACHGIESQLLAFAQGMRQNDISEQMRTIARQLTPEEMHAVAAYYGGGL